MSRRLLLFAFVMTSCLALPRLLSAQETSATGEPEAKKQQVPFVVINVASVDRLLKDTEFMFRSINRPDMFELVQSVLAGTANDLKGIDRTKPLGVMLFLEPGFPPSPQPVLYMPVTNPDEFIQTAALAQTTFAKVEGSDNRYDVKTPRGVQKQTALFSDGLLYMTPSEILLDEILPDPIKLSQALTARYDISVALRINSIPPLMRDVFVTFLRTTTEAEMQPRDGESEAEHKFRKAGAANMMGSIEELLTQVDELTIGWDGNEELRKGVLEINMVARPDSDIAKSLKNLAGRPSMFHIAQQDTGKPLTAGLSWQMNKREKATSLELVEAARLVMTDELTKKEKDVTGANTLCDVVGATVQTGHIDAFVQISVPEPGKFIVAGGVKLQGADAASTAFVNLLQQLPTSDTDDVKLETNIDSHQGVAFQRFSPREQEKNDFFGGVPAFWCGFGQQAFWFTFGAEQAFDTLRDTMDRVLTSGPAPGGQSDPFVLILRRAAWQSLQPNPERRREVTRHELAEQAFDNTNDALKVYTRPTESGVRTRVELEEGFIKVFALFLARQYDASQL